MQLPVVVFVIDYFVGSVNLFVKKNAYELVCESHF